MPWQMDLRMGDPGVSFVYLCVALSPAYCGGMTGSEKRCFIYLPGKNGMQ